jgi:ABC transport system ATP-binding/permease protein
MPSWIIGSDPECDLVVDWPTVSGRHCRLTRMSDGDLLEDLGSSNGTYVNGVRVEGSVVVRPGDRVTLGKRVPMPWPAARADGAAPASAPSPARVLRIGRDPDNDVVIDAPMVSRRHARLVVDGDGARIEDLGSSNGTYVNGVRVRGAAVVRPGDRVGLGSYSFTPNLAGDLEEADDRDGLVIEARDLAVEAGGRTLIEGISMRVEPGEIVGLMGPSGAGKSTLVKALAGYVRPSRGRVLLNGVDLARHRGEFRGLIGYVPQEDIIHRDLTVGEALRYTARLRLPADYGDAEIRRRVADVLDQLDLAGTEDVLIGPPGGSGISGGQRKRVNLAMELLTDPPVLLLDEPTSGLSSEDTLMVLKVVRGLADRGKSILLTIHQPGREAFQMLDRLAVVARDPGPAATGRLAYDGPANPDAIRFFNPPGPGDSASRAEADLSPDDLLRGLARRPVGEWVERLAVLRERGDDAERRRSRRRTDHAPVPQDLRRSTLTQWWTLVRRNVAIKRKDAWNTAILAAQAPVIAILIVLVFARQMGGDTARFEPWKEVAGGVGPATFILGLAALWFGCSNAVREIVGEWPVYRRERMVNLRLGPYIASKLTALGGLGVLQCAVLLAIARHGAGLVGDWPSMLGILVLAAAVGTALGLLISALARSSEVAIALLPLAILPLMIFGGALQPLHKMHPALQRGCDVFPSRWAFEGLMVLESDRRPRAPVAVPDATNLNASPTAGAASPDMAELYFPAETDRMGPRAAAIALAGTFAFLVALIGAILRLRDLH